MDIAAALRRGQQQQQARNGRRETFTPLDYEKYKAACDENRQSTFSDTRSTVELIPLPADPPKARAAQVWRMITVYPVRDMNWIIAVLFALGGFVFTLNALWGFLPLFLSPPPGMPTMSMDGSMGGNMIATPDSNSTDSAAPGAMNDTAGMNLFAGMDEQMMPPPSYVSPVLILVGAIILTSAGIGAFFAAFNVNGGRTDPKTDVEKISDILDPVAEARYRPALIGSAGWQWFPSWYDFLTIYLKNGAFQAGLFQFAGALVFSISAVAGFPGVLNPFDLKSTQLFVFLPQVVGGLGLFVTGVILMVMSQDAWYKPKIFDGSWQASLWSTVGSAGFVIVGALLLIDFTNPSIVFWSLFGSFSLLLGGMLQWYVLMQYY